MRIAMISEHASPLADLGGPDAGGQNTHVADLSTALAARGHDVRVYTRRDGPDLPTTVHTETGYAVVHVPAGPPRPLPKDDLLPYMADFGEWLPEHWRDDGWRPDVVHAHFWMSGVAALTAARRAGVPVTVTYHALGTVKLRHQGGRDTSPAQRIGYERALGRVVDRVIAQCRDEVRELVAMGVDRNRIAIVPSGIDGDLFTPDGPTALRRGAVPRVLTVGRLVERKGYDDVIQAMRGVPGAELVVVGGPPADRLDADPYARSLRYRALSCGVADRVRLTGAVAHDELPGWYRSADVMVTAPWYEPFGLTPLEAMACGVPVIGTAVGGLVDTIVDGHTGDLVAPRDPAALGRALRDLLADPVRRLAYATAGLDRARQKYSWQGTADRLLDVYAAVATARRPSGAMA
jgi:D-inositol-3-phosphate glycosyltransferase